MYGNYSHDMVIKGLPHERMPEQGLPRDVAQVRGAHGLADPTRRHGSARVWEGI